MRRASLRVALFAVIAAVGLSISEYYRRQSARPAPIASEALAATPSETAIERAERFRDPQVFQQLCEDVRTRNIELADWHRTLEHRETHLVEEFDKTGKVIAAERKVERIWYENNRDRRITLEHRDLFADKDKTPKRSEVTSAPPSREIFPFSKEAKSSDYAFTLEGPDVVDNRPALRLRFEPAPPIDHKLRGVVWIDPLTKEPLRLDGELATLPPLVDRVTMNLRWGPAGDGMKPQLMRSVIAGSGGFAFIQKNYRITTDFSDYKMLSPRQ